MRPLYSFSFMVAMAYMSAAVNSIIHKINCRGDEKFARILRGDEKFARILRQKEETFARILRGDQKFARILRSDEKFARILRSDEKFARIMRQYAQNYGVSTQRSLRSSPEVKVRNVLLLQNFFSNDQGIVCPRSSDPFDSKLLYKMEHYFLDIQYH